MKTDLECWVFEACQPSHALLNALEPAAAERGKGSARDLFQSYRQRRKGGGGEKMFDLYPCGVWKVKCDSNMSERKEVGGGGDGGETGCKGSEQITAR